MVEYRNKPSVSSDDKCFRCSEREQKTGRGFYGWENVELIINQIRTDGITNPGQVIRIRDIFEKLCRRKKFALYNAISDKLSPYGREALFRGWVPDPYRIPEEPEPEPVSEPGNLAGWVE